MSLKALHIVFVTVSILLALGFAAWSFVHYADEQRVIDLIFGVGSVLAAAALVVYGKYVLRKLKDISYL